ncbi:response regulator transcription factor [Flavobacterium sp. HJJ]|uniref:response regulator transcription factor n=1 Tax=Flavobacterium sp. HJJ TaxID=2783792 RepID=UPI00188C21CB|nr:response regulator transcription factor [Flavobacterium sp. HJJ]MBF4472559.1 response regulator transcription factor [Flavobacterium sp. HJJ]
MKKALNVLIIDDHPIITEAYKRIFFENIYYEINSHIVTSYGEALIILNSSNFDVVFIDFELSSSNDNLHISAERLTVLIRSKFPKTKIILEISENKPKLFSILKSISFNGLLIKKDVTPEIILQALDIVLTGISFYSLTAAALKSTADKQAYFVDELDLKILQSLSQGVRTKNMVKFIPLSLSAIEKRKSRIKEFFNVKTDELLLDKIREEGLV